MRRIAVVNQKGGVGKTTTTVNLAAALARAGKRVVCVDLDPQANMSVHLGIDASREQRTSYEVLGGGTPLAEALRETSTPGLLALPSNIDLSGAELELSSRLGRESVMRDAVGAWVKEAGGEPADFLLFDCPPSLGLLSINGLVAASEVFIALQTEFFALQGMSKLVEIVQLVRGRLNKELSITGIVPCLYDARLRLAREVLGEIRRYFPVEVFRRGIGTNVKLAEAPGFGQTIFEYAPDSNGARDYTLLAEAVLAQGGSGGEPVVPAGQLDRDEPVVVAGENEKPAVLEPAPRPREHAGELEDIVRAEDLPELPPEVFRPVAEQEG